ncbi:MAG: type II secretion system protein GspK [Verrucomicrobiae bacterium]|nr:type II secretion system protein GspK [Verrucomicrobiae bacterium]
MQLQPPTRTGDRREQASVLVIVLWICIGLVSIVLYFANSMTYELRAADNRVNGLVADQAIEGAARYFAVALQNYATNGAVPDNSQFKCASVTIGDARFWMIGRDPAGGNNTEPYFGLIDEGGKINLNNANTNTLAYLPNMTMDFSDAIQDWRGTNGIVSLNYASLGYLPKNAPFESVDELRLVYGADISLLAGEDLNRNGVLDKNEKDLNGNGELDPGLFEYTTVYTREPNFHSDGTTLTNVNDSNLGQSALTTELTALFRNDGVSSPGPLASRLATYLRPTTGGTSGTGNTGRTGGAGSTGRTGSTGGTGGTGSTGGTGGTASTGSTGSGSTTTRKVNGLFDFAVLCRQNGMSADDFGRIVSDVTTSTNTYLRGRINVNTASADVLTAVFMGLNVDQQTAEGAAQTLVTYRQQNPDNLASVAWVYDALGSSTVVQTLQRGDYITTHSFQFTADIAGVGAFGRGYRRVRFIFDVSDGSPKILYRQDLSRLGWALGEKARQNLLAKDTQ